jgi:ACT domain-containing protein
VKRKQSRREFSSSHENKNLYIVKTDRLKTGGFMKKINRKEFLKRCETEGFASLAKELGVSRQLVRYYYKRLGGKRKFRTKKFEII